MSIVRLKHVDRFKDRHGRTRYYFRKGKGARKVLPGVPGADDFMIAYQAALGGEGTSREARKRGATGTFDRLVQDYYASADYKRLATDTQGAYQRIIDSLLREANIGHRLVAQMTRQHVQLIVGRRAATPAAANHFLKKLRILLRFAIDNGWRKDDPTIRIRMFAGGEFHAWTEDEIRQFERRWPVGTRERTAFALLLFTGQRGSDVRRMGWQDVRENAIHVVQLKTGQKLWIPLHADLAAVLQPCRRDVGSILQTTFGKPFTVKGIGNFMANRIAASGLPPRCVMHGLRKAAARRLAEAGCSTKEIAAITGHRTLQEIERYTKAADQKRLAVAAMERLEGQKPNANSQTGSKFGKN
jgi:integrase